MKKISQCYGLLLPGLVISFALPACTSSISPKLSPEETLQYSNTPCVNARMIEEKYTCFEHDWAEPLTAPGLDNLNKVDEDYYRSGQPESGGFASAENLGIKTIISIRESDNDEDLSQKEPTSIKLIHIPLDTTGVTQEDVGRVLNAIHKAEKPVLIHCRHGSDRTGLITAYYRIVFNQWTREEARAELLYGGFGHHTMFTNIPELVLDGDLEVIKTIALSE